MKKTAFLSAVVLVLITNSFIHAQSNILANPTATQNPDGTWLVSLYGTFTTANVLKVEVYHKVAGPGAFTLSPQLATTGINMLGFKFYTWAGIYGAGFTSGTILEYYTKLHWTDAAGNPAIIQSNTVQVTLP